MPHHIVWITPDGVQHTGVLENRPFITKHFIVPEANHCKIIPVPALREHATEVDDITTDTITSRVMEELEGLSTQTDIIDTTAGTLIFIGGIDPEGGQCTIM